MKLDFEQLLNELPQKEGADITLSTDLTIGQIISALLPYIFIGAGILVALYLLYGGFHFMISQGDAKATQEARGKITNAIVGFIIIFAAYWIVQLLTLALRLDVVRGIFGLGTNEEIRSTQIVQCQNNCNEAVARRIRELQEQYPEEDPANPSAELSKQLEQAYEQYFQCFVGCENR